MNILWEELTAGSTNNGHLLRVFLRLFAAILLGGLIGLQRGNAKKSAGLRTHIMVCLGTTAILLSPVSIPKRVVSGLPPFSRTVRNG